MINNSFLGMSRRRLLGASLLSALAIGVTPAQAQTPQTLRVGFVKHYRPFSFIDEKGQLQGFDVDVVGVVLGSLGIEIQPVSDSLKKLEEMMKKGEIDFIGNQLLRTSENRRSFDFVSPYASIQLVTVQHESDDNDYFSLDDMLGRRLGVLANSGVADQAKGALGQSVQSFDQIDVAFRALAAKELDLVLEENLIADYHIEQYALPLRVGTPMTAPVSVGLAVPKGQKQLQDKLSMAVQTMLKDKSFRPVSNKWFGYDVSRPRVSHASA